MLQHNPMQGVSMPVFRRRLPHIYIDQHPVFVTWRLEFSLPQCLLRQLREQKDALTHKLESLSEEYKKLQLYQHSKKQFDLTDAVLGTDTSLPHSLMLPELAAIITESLHFLDSRKYCLHAFCIMPNHLHLLITPYRFETKAHTELSDILKSLKGFTAHKINKLLHREGAFWHSESYDHYIRSEVEFYRVVDYIVQNPVKAKLVQSWWQWQHTWLEAPLRERYPTP